MAFTLMVEVPMQSPLLVSLIVVALGGCAARGAAPTADPPMTWGFNQTDEGAKLAYGVDETDNVAVMMICQPGSGLVKISVGVASVDVAPLLRLSSKGASSSAAGAVFEDDFGPMLEATSPTHLAVLSAFAESGQLSVRAGGSTFDATSTDRTPVRQFFAACRR